MQHYRPLPRGAHDPQGETKMTTFDEREQAYEKKFALDQDLKFRAESQDAVGPRAVPGGGVDVPRRPDLDQARAPRSRKLTRTLDAAERIVGGGEQQRRKAEPSHGAGAEAEAVLRPGLP